MKYCEFCAKKLENGQKCDCAEAVLKESEPAISKKKLLAFIISAILTALIVITIFICIDKQSASKYLKLDPFEYTEVTFEGLNSQGKAVVTFNRDKMVDDLMKQELNTDDEAEIEALLAEYTAYYDGMDYDCTPATSLSNGDTVTVTFTVNNIINDKVKSGSKSYTVSGLMEPTTIDIFENIEISYSGLSGKARAIVKVLNEDPLASECYFEIEPSYNLSSGDEIEVKISSGSIKKLSETHNVIPKVTSKKYIVPTLAEYITSIEQLPLDVIESFANKFLNDNASAAKNEMGLSYDNFRYYGSYYFVKKDEDRGQYQNILRIFIAYDRYYRGEFEETIYKPLDFYNITTTLDDSDIIEYKNGVSIIATNDIDSHFASYEEDYNILKIDN